jgi:hypothetical protein
MFDAMCLLLPGRSVNWIRRECDVVPEMMDLASFLLVSITSHFLWDKHHCLCSKNLVGTVLDRLDDCGYM